MMKDTTLVKDATIEELLEELNMRVQDLNMYDVDKLSTKELQELERQTEILEYETVIKLTDVVTFELAFRTIRAFETVMGGQLNE